MRKAVIGAVVVVLALAAGVYYYRGQSGSTAQNAGDTAGDGRGGGRRGGGAGGVGGGGGGGGFPAGGRFQGGGGRGPMTVEVARATRASISEEIVVVGNLIGEQTVSVVPRTAGRLQDVYVRLGDRVSRNQRLAKIEDYEIVEQVKQAEAAQEVSLATIRQREADLKLAETSAERSRNLYQRQLLPKQTLDDNEARYQAAVAQLDLARAQTTQSKARLDELRINLGNTIITSPVNGFVARRAVDPGAFVSNNQPVADVVDITTVRLVANVVEKDLKQMQSGNATRVQVDAYPGETFKGRIARVSPVLDPATRTAPIEVEIPNPEFRLKPGMYARVGITTDVKKDALVVPVNAVIDLGGRRGVFQPQNESAIFRSVQVGTEQRDVIEILGGIVEGDMVITTGAGALRDGDRILLPGRSGGGRGRRGDAAAGQPGGDGATQGGAPQTGSPSEATRQGGAGREGGSKGRDGSPGPQGGREFSGSGRRSGADGQRYGGDGRRLGGDGSTRGGQRPASPSSQE